MNLFEALLYGAVQGITEYLPISSSAHLILLPKFLGTQDPGLSFDVFLHAGTLASTLIYFRKDWLQVAQEGIQLVSKSGKKIPLNQNLFVLIALGTVPALIAGALAHKWVSTVLRGNQVLIFTLTFGGFLLWGVDWWRERRSKKATRPLKAARITDAVWVGVAQCFALVPGMSRSGSTMIGGRLLGFDRASAARLSFLLSGPITAAALIFELRHWRELLQESIGVGPLVVGAVSAFVFGWLAIDGLLKLLRRFGYASFAVYRVLLAIVIYKVLGTAI